LRPQKGATAISMCVGGSLKTPQKSHDVAACNIFPLGQPKVEFQGLLGVNGIPSWQGTWKAETTSGGVGGVDRFICVVK
jgi:hypothetical protein